LNAVVLRQAEVEDMAAVEDALLEAFQALVADARVPSVVVLQERDIAAQGAPAAAALAHGLLGLVRALTIEGFTVNALTVADDGSVDDEAQWIDRLSEPRGMSGQLIRLATSGVGRIVP
jgi:hypothetical protein